jgi:hypothetical protein
VDAVRVEMETGKKRKRRCGNGRGVSAFIGARKSDPQCPDRTVQGRGFRSDGCNGPTAWKGENQAGSRSTHAEAEEKARFAVPCPQLAAEAVAAQVRSGVKRLAISAARAKDGEIDSLIPMFF